ncbi:MAG: hypothetical protein WDZ34_02440 [Candidatus Saccharimonadales bacterium]
MPIECNVSSNRGDLERHQPIEPGKAHSYHFNAGSIGMVVVACCHESDVGGRIYVMDEESFENAIDEYGIYSGESLDKNPYEILPPGGTMPVTVRPDAGEDETTFFFTHQSPN